MDSCSSSSRRPVSYSLLKTITWPNILLSPHFSNFGPSPTFAVMIYQLTLYSLRSDCHSAGTRPAGPGTGWSRGCAWGAGSLGPVKKSLVR
jgi:hypothetical protein